MNAAKRTEEVTHGRPHAFSGVGMNFADAIAIIIPGPFLIGVTDGGVGPDNMVVSLPFIGVDLGSGQGEGVDVVFQSFAIRVMDDPQPDLARFPAHRPDHGRTVIVIGPVSDLFIGPAARRVSRVRVIVTFFPPHSETFHLFQFGDQAALFAVDGVRH